MLLILLLTFIDYSPIITFLTKVKIAFKNVTENVKLNLKSVSYDSILIFSQDDAQPAVGYLEPAIQGSSTFKAKAYFVNVLHTSDVWGDPELQFGNIKSRVYLFKQILLSISIL